MPILLKRTGELTAADQPILDVLNAVRWVRTTGAQVDLPTRVIVCGFSAGSTIGATRTVLVLVGPALRGAAARSHLYAPQFAHMFRRRSRSESTVGRPA